MPVVRGMKREAPNRKANQVCKKMAIIQLRRHPSK